MNTNICGKSIEINMEFKIVVTLDRAWNGRKMGTRRGTGVSTVFIIFYFLSCLVGTWCSLCSISFVK